jgi:hypothetical protein
MGQANQTDRNGYQSLQEKEYRAHHRFCFFGKEQANQVQYGNLEIITNSPIRRDLDTYLVRVYR